MAVDTEKIATEAPVQQPSTVEDEVEVEYYIDPVEERKVLWKIDRTIMPILFITFFFQCK